MIRFDHLVIAVRDLDRATADFQRIGFDVRPGGRHEGFGTRNAIVRFGLDYLELITVEYEQLALQTSRGALVAFLKDHAIGLCAYALATDDLDRLAGLAREVGIQADGPFTMRRRRPDGSSLSWRLLVPGGDQYFQVWPFFIQWDQPDAERMALEVPGVHPNGAIGVAGLDVAAVDLSDATEWHRAMRLEPADGIRPLVPAEPETFNGPRSVTLRVRDLQETRTCLSDRGLRLEPASENSDTWRLVDGPLPEALRFSKI